MTVATKLTMARLVLAPLFVHFLLRETVHSLWIASAIFVVAALTDTADGYLARKTGTVTKIGRILDPLADKLLVGFAYLSFAVLGVTGVKGWMVGSILGREFLVTGLRSFAGRRGVEIHSSPFGKWKTFLQMGVVFGLLLMMSLRAAGNPSPAYWKDPQGFLADAFYVALIATTAVTLLSGLDYVWKNRRLLWGGSS
jgi:CDP-diacylglycerol--glycerol-3-phosphate 3-phosphatidyltransferase